MVILVPMLPEGRPESDPDATIPTNIRSISPDLVETMKMRLLRGRSFTEQDRAGNELVMIVSKSLARSAWPGEDPLDRQIRYALPGYQFPWMRVVGVVDDVLDNGEIESTAYVAYNQFDSPAEFMDIVIRTDPEPMSLLPPVREAIWSINSEQPIADIVTADALLGHGMLLAGIGVLVGLIFAAALTRFLATLLYEVSPLDPVTFAGIAVVTLLVAFVANYLPARRATRVDPVDVIRYQ